MSVFVCSVVATVNVIVDPYNLNGWIDKVDFNHEKPSLRRNQRLSKVFEVSRMRPPVIFLGTSRAAHGLDPLHPALAGKRTYNLAIDGANISEIRILFEHAIALSGANIVIVGLDYGSFDKGGLKPGLKPELLDIGNETRRNARLLEAVQKSLSLETLFASYQTIRCQHIPPEFTHQGQRTSKYYVDFISEFGGVREAFEGYLKEVTNKRPTVSKLAHENIPTSMDEFKAMINQARRQGVTLYLFISPTHAWEQEQIRARGEWNNFKDWKRELVKIVDGVPRRLSSWKLSAMLYQ
jgi:hypothetical protein